MVREKTKTRKGDAKGSKRQALRQATRRVRLGLNIANEVNIDLIDRWLTEVLEFEIEPMPEGLLEECDVPEEAIAFCWRQLILYRALMQIATMPVFDLGEICEASPLPEGGKEYCFVVRIVPITNLVGVSYAGVFSFLARLSSYMSNHEIEADSREALFRAILTNKGVFRGHLPADLTRVPILETALEMGIPFEHAGRGVYQLGWGRNGRMLDGSATEDDPRLGFLLSKQKVTTAGLMRAAGLPTAQSYTVRTKREARAAVKTIGWPVVVKPTSREGGAGVSTQVTDQKKLAAAFALIKETAVKGEVLEAMIERQHRGACHRLFVYDDELLFAAKRSPTAVVGDGQQTVEQLVAEYNLKQQGRPPWKAAPAIPVDGELMEVLNAAGIALDSVPDKGESVNLRFVESVRWGGRGEDITDKVHPENRLIARRCAELLCLKVAGVDIISEDISVPWYENDAIINEINFKPFFGNFDLTRPYVRPYLDDLFEGRDGRIPVMAFVGDKKAHAAAKREQQKAANKGENWVVTDGKLTHLADATELHIAISGIAARSRALTYNRAVEGILLIVTDDELMRSDLVFDRIDSVTDCRSAEDREKIDDAVLEKLEKLAS